MKKIPNFKTEDQERDFWSDHDATDYFKIDQAKSVRFPNLKPSTETIALRLPVFLLEEIKLLAHKEDVPYQSLMKHMLFEKTKEQVRTR
ncbi:MAG: BrnA antitoxin family protein [Patescibacteria group bacterium]|jgi:predicted DNA binding CopG/RHH family protein